MTPALSLHQICYVLVWEQPSKPRGTTGVGLRRPPGKPFCGKVDSQTVKTKPHSSTDWKKIFFPFIFISWRLITLQYCSGFCNALTCICMQIQNVVSATFCNTLTWISHGFTCVPHPDPPSCLPLHPIPLGLPSASALSTCLMQTD